MSNSYFSPRVIMFHNEIWKTFIKTKELMIKHNLSLNDVKLWYAENEDILNDIKNFDIISIYSSITLATQIKEQYQAFIDFSQMARDPSITNLHEQLVDNRRNDLFATMTYLRNLIGHCGFMFSLDGKQLRIKRTQNDITKKDLQKYVDASISIIEKEMLKNNNCYRPANIPIAKNYVVEAAFNPHGNMNTNEVFNRLIDIFNVNTNNSNDQPQVNFSNFLENQENNPNIPNYLNDKLFNFVIYKKLNELILANPDKKFKEIQNLLIQHIEKYKDSPIYLKLLNFIQNPENLLDYDAIVYSIFVFTAGFDRTADHLDKINLSTKDGEIINYEDLRGAIIHSRYFKRNGKFILKSYNEQGEAKHQRYQREQRQFPSMRLREKQSAIRNMTYEDADFKEEYALTRDDIYYLCDILSEKVYERENA